MTTDDQHPGPADAPPPAPPEPLPPVGPADTARREPAGTAVPDEETLATIATPAVLRRAPRIGAFIRTGLLLGAVLGWVLAILFSGTTGEGRTGAILITTAAGAGFGALLGAAVAALVDRRGAGPAGAGRTARRRTAR